MPLSEIWGIVEDQLFPVPSTDVLFNQYRDIDSELDQPDAARIRRENLQRYLQSFTGMPSVLVVGEAVGYRGGRFSGVPLISEKHLVTPGVCAFIGRQSSLGGPYSEQTATIIWKAMIPHQPRVFTWNCVPLHPHRAGVALSNRTPTVSELALYAPLLHELYCVIRPEQVVALGKKAAASLTGLGIRHRYVRHPANGGATAFRAGIAELLTPASEEKEYARQRGTSV